MADYLDAREVERWVIDQWDEQVANRPLSNVHRRTLDETWRHVFRYITNGRELPRPKHRDPPSDGECPLCHKHK